MPDEIPDVYIPIVSEREQCRVKVAWKRENEWDATFLFDLYLSS